MDLETYRKNRIDRSLPTFQTPCRTCMQNSHWCYCDSVHPFDPGITFAILIHHLENRRRVATGRMSHLALEGSHLILGHRYDDDPRVNALIDDPRFDPVVLFPSKDALPIDETESAELTKRFDRTKKRLLIFVVDGTWATARKTVLRSENLRRLPRIRFPPRSPSRFRIRHQPKVECMSTIEAIHRAIDLLGPSQGFDVTTRNHDRLLEIFDRFVQRRIDHIEALVARTGTLHPRKKSGRHARR